MNTMNTIAKGKAQRAWRLSLSDKRIDCFYLPALCPMPLTLSAWAKGRAHGDGVFQLEELIALSTHVFFAPCPLRFAFCALPLPLCASHLLVIRNDLLLKQFTNEPNPETGN